MLKLQSFPTDVEAADDAVNAYVDGTLPEVGDATCDHHEHEGHGEHGCDHGGCHQ